MPRERSLSGTIPSMETSHEELKDNTVIVGEHRSSPHPSPSHLYPSPGGFWRSGKEEGTSAVMPLRRPLISIVLDFPCLVRPLSPGFPSPRRQDRRLR